MVSFRTGLVLAVLRIVLFRFRPAKNSLFLLRLLGLTLLDCMTRMDQRNCFAYNWLRARLDWFVTEFRFGLELCIGLDQVANLWIPDGIAVMFLQMGDGADERIPGAETVGSAPFDAPVDFFSRATARFLSSCSGVRVSCLLSGYTVALRQSDSGEGVRGKPVFIGGKYFNML